jgi:uncharacterized phage infection (PIP) family protein YhgE
MSLYTLPVSTAFELQRTTLEESRRAVDATLGLQEGVNRSVVRSVESQERIQRQLLSIQQVTLHRLARRLEERSPGPPDVTAELLEVIDEQFDQLYQSHAELFDGINTELENGTEAYDEVTQDSLEALDEQLDVLLQTSEQLESQSLETAQQLEDQLAPLQEQLGEIQAQLDSAGGLTGNE